MHSMSSQHTRLLPTLNVFHKTVVHTFCMHSPWACRQGIQQSLYVRHNVQPHLSEVTELSFNSVSADACTELKQAACSGCLTAALFKNSAAYSPSCSSKAAAWLMHTILQETCFGTLPSPCKISMMSPPRSHWEAVAA